jgi:phosphate starvation-inducible PhoH-like protein
LEDTASELTVVLADNEEAASLLGHHDENLKAMEEALGARIVARGNELIIRGHSSAVGNTSKLVNELTRFIRQGQHLCADDVRAVASRLVQRTPSAEPSQVILVSDRGKPVRARTPTQEEYVETIRQDDLVFAIGPAGTGKTYLAVACAVAALQRKEVARIILIRPAVEAGEKLGFLPGDLQAKIDPYLRPLFDALYDLLDHDKLQRLLERSVIEVAPLAFMRGRTLNDSFIILDEAQNTTREQMKMFLTRLGFGSKAVVTGDITQIDLPGGQVSGLNHAREILADVGGITFVYFSDRDVVRHELVRRIIRAYERVDERNRKEAGPPDARQGPGLPRER